MQGSGLSVSICSVMIILGLALRVDRPKLWLRDLFGLRRGLRTSFGCGLRPDLVPAGLLSLMSRPFAAKIGSAGISKPVSQNPALAGCLADMEVAMSGPIAGEILLVRR